MSQYERIVSYIYQYQQGEKGANVGYAKVEKRGGMCRVSIQMRAVSVKAMPKVYLYQQLEQGIQTIYAGQMMVRGSNMLFKTSSSAEKLFGSEKGLDEVDGIFIDTADVVYFATSWKNDKFFLGNWGNKSTIVENGNTMIEKEVSGKSQRQDEMENVVKDKTNRGTSAEKTESVADEKAEGILHQEEIQSQQVKTVKSLPVDTTQPQQENQTQSQSKETGHSQQAEKIQLQSQSVETVQQNEMVKNMEIDITEKEEEKVDETSGKVNDITKENDIQMQSICGVCPFKRKVYDYGKKILMTFPSMKPFQSGVAKACVRMELQDIGCLPIASWSLSGNRFLLHGYYCYRHLLFAQMEDGRYVLGVPGIYSEKDWKNACRFGFSDFQSIGDFGMQRGAFGYWLLELPRENQSSSLR